MATAYLLMYSGAEGPSARLSSQESDALLLQVPKLQRPVSSADPVALQGVACGGVMVDFSEDPAAPIDSLVAKDGIVALYGRSEHEPKYLVDDAGVENAVRAAMLQVPLGVRAP